ncbi:MAG: hypothetical protein QOD47_2184 [Gemmatimonadaceae bacterium]|jgi:hypothetical protein|nr:hypothetical protein [Gemmatimonadaceae bacterium]
MSLLLVGSALVQKYEIAIQARFALRPLLDSPVDRIAKKSKSSFGARVLAGVFLATVLLCRFCIIAAWENRRIASSVRRPREKLSDLRPIQGTIGRSSRISHVIGMARS